MKLSESAILTVAAAIAGIAALFTLIGLTTPKWLRHGVGLWNCNQVCSTSAATLTILALLLLVISVVTLILIVIQLFPRILRALPFALLVIATLFLLAATASYLRQLRVVGYSFELMVTAHALAFLGSILLAFWFGTTWEDKPRVNTTRAPAPNPTIAFPSARRPWKFRSSRFVWYLICTVTLVKSLFSERKTPSKCTRCFSSNVCENLRTWLPLSSIDDIDGRWPHVHRWIYCPRLTRSGTKKRRKYKRSAFSCQNHHSLDRYVYNTHIRTADSTSDVWSSSSPFIARWSSVCRTFLPCTRSTSMQALSENLLWHVCSSAQALCPARDEWYR